MKFAICTLCINDWYAEIVKYGVKTIENYAKKHGYDFYICNEVYDGEREFPWYKIKAIQKILPDYDMIMWIDADGHIMLPELSIDYFVHKYMDSKTDILCSRDWGVLNTGIMIIRNTPWVKEILNKTWNNDIPFNKDFHEQASLSSLYTNNVLFAQDKIKILPLGSLFCYWREYYPKKFFFVHIARCAYDPVGFVYTLDTYCPIKMDEDKPGEYEERIDWLNNLRCLKDIEGWKNNGNRTRISTRTELYIKQHKND